MKKLLIILLLLLTVACAPKDVNVVKKCIDLCNSYEQDKSNGPCLDNYLDKGWVCDIAHTPRSGLDNLPENQCNEYGKTAMHFVEVDANCEIIRVA